MNFGKNLGKRIVLYIFGLFIVAVGGRLSLIANLGLGSSLAWARAMEYVVGQSIAFWTFWPNILCVVVQIILLRKDFKPIQFIQVAAAFIFSLFMAYVDPLVRWWVPANYVVRLIQLLISTMFSALGIFCVVKAKLITMPIESMNLVIMEKVGKGELGTYKILYDAFWFICAIIVSLIATFGRGAFDFGFFLDLSGIREGTVIMLILVGVFMNIYEKLFGKAFDKLSE